MGLEIALVGLCLYGVLALLLVGNVPYAGSGGIVASVVLIAWIQRRRGSNLGGLGLERPTKWGRTVLCTLAALIATVLVGVIVLPWLRDFFSGPPVVRDDTDMLVRLIRTVVIAWFAAAFGEELVFRGFLLDRLLRILPQGRVGVAAAVMLQAVIFGASHYTQGWSGVIAAGMIGAIFGFIYVAAGRNLWPVIVAHALPDTISLLGV